MEPSLTTHRRHGRPTCTACAYCRSPRRPTGYELKRPSPISHLVAGLEPFASSAAMTPISAAAARCSRSASAFPMSWRASSRSTPRPRRGTRRRRRATTSPALARAGPVDRVLGRSPSGSSAGRAASSSAGAVQEDRVAQLVEALAGRRGDRDHARTGSPSRRRHSPPTRLDLLGRQQVRLAQHDEPGRSLEPRAVAAQLRRAPPRRSSHGSPPSAARCRPGARAAACARRGRGTRGRARRRRRRPRSAPGCRRAPAGGPRRPRWSRAPARAS